MVLKIIKPRYSFDKFGDILDNARFVDKGYMHSYYEAKHPGSWDTTEDWLYHHDEVVPLATPKSAIVKKKREKKKVKWYADEQPKKSSEEIPF